jgi:hypothetical protein
LVESNGCDEYSLQHAVSRVGHTTV